MRLFLLLAVCVCVSSVAEPRRGGHGGGYTHRSSQAMPVRNATAAEMEASKDAVLYLNGKVADDAELERYGKYIDELVRKRDLASVKGDRHPYLCKLAKEYLKYFVTVKPEVSGHPLYVRNEKHISAMPGGKYQENSGGVVSDHPQNAEFMSEFLVEGWIKSPGHYENLKGKWQHYCHMVAHTKEGKYYGIGLFANGELPKVEK